jgi:2-polyprenyl-3-methyl-5-hydroxy-6-metoxy-1,4-benzoquinol methylase
MIELRPYNYFFSIEKMFELITGKHLEGLTTEEIDSELKKDNKWKKLSVLDVGCADGVLGGILKANGHTGEYAGVDYSEMARKAFSERHKLVWRDISEVYKTFDVVCSLQAIEHVDEPHDFVRKMFDRVNAGGILVITTPIENKIPSQFHKSKFDFYWMLDVCRSLNPKDFHIYYINRDIKTAQSLNCFGLVIFK